MYYLTFRPQVEAKETAAHKTLTIDCDYLPMILSPELTLLVVGAGFGLGLAIVGAFSEYWLSIRPSAADRAHQLPGCLFYVVGGLALSGIVALVISFLLSGSTRPAVIVGAGVLSGFYIGFVLVFILWLLIKR